jgi:hypothetical protein
MSPSFDAADAARIPCPWNADLVFDNFPAPRSYFQRPPSPLTYTEPSRPRAKARLNRVDPSGALKTSPSSITERGSGVCKLPLLKLHDTHPYSRLSYSRARSGRAASGRKWSSA